MADAGTGMAVAYDSSFFGSATSIEWSDITRESIPTSTLATTGGKTFQASETYDPGTMTIEGFIAPGVTPTIISTSASETATLTFTNADLSTWAATGFIDQYSAQASDADGRVTYTARIKLSGTITITL